MENKVSKKNIVLAVSTFLIIILLISGLFYFNIKKHASVTVEATVKYVGEDYIVVEDSTQEQYSLPTTEEYNVGDRVSFVIKDIQKETDPKEGTVLKIDTVSKSVTFSIMDPSSDNSENENIETENFNNTISTENNKENLQSTEEDVIQYFQTLDKKIDTYSTDKAIGESIKNGFVTVVDFLFYDGKIYGKTFDELSDNAKLKVLKLALSIDKKIEEYFPTYKEYISSAGSKIYTNVKEKVISTYLDITTKVCENHQDLCDSAKKGLADMKKSFSFTWDMIKEISGVGISKLKAWYEVWKDAND